MLCTGVIICFISWLIDCWKYRVTDRLIDRLIDCALVCNFSVIYACFAFTCSIKGLAREIINTIRHHNWKCGTVGSGLRPQVVLQVFLRAPTRAGNFETQNKRRLPRAMNRTPDMRMEARRGKMTLPILLRECFRCFVSLFVWRATRTLPSTPGGDVQIQGLLNPTESLAQKVSQFLKR